jgi:hypothetical protein
VYCSLVHAFCCYKDRKIHSVHFGSWQRYAKLGACILELEKCNWVHHSKAVAGSQRIQDNTARIYSKEFNPIYDQSTCLIALDLHRISGQIKKNTKYKKIQNIVHSIFGKVALSLL